MEKGNVKLSSLGRNTPGICNSLCSGSIFAQRLPLSKSDLQGDLSITPGGKGTTSKSAVSLVMASLAALWPQHLKQYRNSVAARRCPEERTRRQAEAWGEPR